MADSSTQLPLSALNTLVSESIDLVVQCTRTAAGPTVTEVVAVEDLASGADAAQFTVTEVFRSPAATGPLAWTGNLPVRCERRFNDYGFDLRRLVGAGR